MCVSTCFIRVFTNTNNFNEPGCNSSDSYTCHEDCLKSTKCSLLLNLFEKETPSVINACIHPVRGKAVCEETQCDQLNKNIRKRTCCEN